MAKASKKKTTALESGPVAERPHIAPVYGVPKNKKGLLDWSHVTERMTNAKVYWISTADRKGKPHATPVDGLWIDNALYFGGDPTTRRNRNLAVNPATNVHLEEGHNVVILEGESVPVPTDAPDLAQRLADASAAKYGFGFPPETYAVPGMYYVFRPRVAFAWSQFPRDMTRWEFVP